MRLALTLLEIERPGRAPLEDAALCAEELQFPALVHMYGSRATMMAIACVLRLLRYRDVFQTRALRAALYPGQPPVTVTIEKVLSCGMYRVEVTRPAFCHHRQIFGICHRRIRIFTEVPMLPLPNKLNVLGIGREFADEPVKARISRFEIFLPAFFSCQIGRAHV